MYDCTRTYGESCYRLITRTGDFVYLRTRGSLEIDPDTNEVRSFMCHNILVDEEEGKQLVREMKRKYAIMISDSEYNAPEDDDDPGVENPVQLERAIISLITGLQTNSEPIGSPPMEIFPSDEHDSDNSRSGKTPPILIPPQTSTIKPTISRSTNIVEKNLRGKSPRSSDDESNRPNVSSTVHRSKGKIFDISDDEQSVSSNSPQKINHRGKFMYDEDEIDKIKCEIIDARVPPLPISAGYFDTSSSCGSPNSCTENVMEYKPLDLLRYEEMHQASTSNPSSSISLNDTNKRLLKRSISSDSESDRSSKKRLISKSSNAECTLNNSESDVKPSFSLHNAYINQLNDPNTSK